MGGSKQSKNLKNVKTQESFNLNLKLLRLLLDVTSGSSDFHSLKAL